MRDERYWKKEKKRKYVDGQRKRKTCSGEREGRKGKRGDIRDTE